MSEEFTPFPADVQARIAENAVRTARPVVPQAPLRTNVRLDDPAQAAPTVPEMPNGVPNPAPAFTNPSSDPVGVSVNLPSRFAFYDFKDLYVTPFRTGHLGKLTKAHEDSSLIHLVEAVSSVLSTTFGVPNLGFKLHVADFYFVLYWLKLHSYTKSQVIHSTVCMNPAHQERVANGELAADTLKITQVYTESQLEVVELETLPDPDVFKLPGEGWYLRPSTMQDVIETMEHPEWPDSEFLYLATLASNISCRRPDGTEPTLAERIEYVKDLPPDVSFIISKHEKLMDHFGVNESVVVTCKWCRASRKSKIVLDAHSFLSADDE